MSETDYARSVVRVLRGHFPDLADPAIAAVVANAVQRNARDPQPGFEVIVSDPITAKWRLRPNSGNPRFVHVTCHRASPRPADSELEHAVNDALRALEAGQ